jgi:fumarate reductase (CoM/CoB) subunit B
MANPETVRAKIFRYAPDVDPEPHYETYQVPYEPDMRVLDVLEGIVEDQGVSLAYRWFCGVKKCGGCGMLVNGRPILACWEPAEAEMVIEPLPNFPVIRDLVIDRSTYDERTTLLEPVLQRKDPYPGFPEPLTSIQMAGAAEMMNCIECLLCTSMCPSYGEVFVGPASLVQLSKVALDPRDGISRALIAYAEGQISECVSCYECTQACPTGIQVLEHAIDGLRKQIVSEDIGDIAHHNHVYKELTLTQGLVNPVSLMLRSKGFRLIAELPQAFILLKAGRLTLRSLWDGIFNRKKMRHLDEVNALAEALEAEKRL